MGLVEEDGERLEQVGVEDGELPGVVGDDELLELDDEVWDERKQNLLAQRRQSVGLVLRTEPGVEWGREGEVSPSLLRGRGWRVGVAGGQGWVLQGRQ